MENSENIKLLAEKSESLEKNKIKRDYYIELVLFLILGILIGVAVKTEASRRITIGYNDYRMKIGANQYNINQLQSIWIKKQNAETDKSASQAADPNSAEGASCSANQ
jgi:hypothetical protein